MKKFYPLIRAIHLYNGLFISPFVLILGLSVLVFNHPEFFKKSTPDNNSETASIKLDSIPVRQSDMLTAKAILQKLRIKGEIDYINKTDSSMFFPVNTTGKTYRISVNKLTADVSVNKMDKDLYEATTYLHSMPGPHNVALRGNSGFIRLWRYLIDIIVYSVLFLTVSGVFMWSFYQSERKTGIISAGIGILLMVILLILTF